MSRRWFSGLRSATCEIPGCGKPADRSVFILGGSRAWLCAEHADSLDIAASLKRASEPVDRPAHPADATPEAAAPAQDEEPSEAAPPVSNEATPEAATPAS